MFRGEAGVGVTDVNMAGGGDVVLAGAGGARASPSHAVFDGPGEMRALCRALDWSATPLGPVSEWPVSLRTTVGMLLGSRHPMFLWWGPQLVQLFNDAYRPSFGESGRHVEALGASGASFWTEIWDVIGPQIAQVMAGGEATWHEDQLIPIWRNGRVEDVWWTYSYSPVADDEGHIGGTLVVCQETTHRVLSEYEREWLLDITVRAERRAANVLERMADAQFALDDQFRFLSANDAMERGAGIARDDLIGRTIWEAFPANVGTDLERNYRQVAESRVEAHFTYDYSDAHVDRVVDVDVYPVEEGGIAVFWRDITSRARAEALSRSRETELRTLADAIPTLAWTARADGYIEWYNARWYEYTGTTAEQTEGWGWQTVHDASTLPRVLEQWRSCIATGQPFEMLYPLRGADGQFRTFLTRIVPVRGADGRVARWFGTSTDVDSEAHLRQEAEAARERTSRLHELTAALSSSSTVSEIADAIVAHATAVLGAVGTVMTRLSADGARLELLQASHMPDHLRAHWRDFPINAAVPLAEVVRTREAIFLESRVQWLASYPDAGPMLEATGHHANVVLPLVVDERVLGAMGAAYDAPRAFTADERAAALAVARQCAQALDRARLFESERTARAVAEAANRAKGDFLAVISHELRTPLNAIAGHAELIELGIYGPVTPEQLAALARIQKSQRHLLGLINGVLNYSRIEAGALHYAVTDVSVDEVLATCEALVAPQARAKRLALHYEDCDPALTVRADAEKLQQIILNLVTNSIKFTDPGGRIGLACAMSGAQVSISISDTGRGIAADQIARVFEPFVQVDAQLTRTQEGVGLGLAISRDLARGMGGDLTAESMPGRGSTFTLTLPAV